MNKGKSHQWVGEGTHFVPTLRVSHKVSCWPFIFFQPPFSSDFFQPVENKGAWLQSERSKKKKKTLPAAHEQDANCPIREMFFLQESTFDVSPRPALFAVGADTQHSLASLERLCVRLQRRNAVKQPSLLPCSRQQQFSGMLQLEPPPVSEAAKAARSLPDSLIFFFTPSVFSFHAPRRRLLSLPVVPSRCDAVCFSFRPVAKTHFPLLFISASLSLQLLLGPPWAPPV